MSLETPGITEAKAQRAAVIHVTVPRDQIEAVMDSTIGEMMDALAAQGIAPTGPMFAHHLKTDPEIFDFDLGFPVSKPVEAAGRMRPGELPGGRVVRTVYQGPY